MIKVAFITTDNREHLKDYNNPHVHFGTAPTALLEGFRTLSDHVEIHVISCLQRPPISSPQQLAENIFYHPIVVPKSGWMRSAYLGCSRAIHEKLRAIGPDIVHGQGTERECAISAVRSGFPNILTLHGNMRSIAKLLRARPLSFYWLAAKLETHCLRRTRGVIAISSYTQRNVAPFVKKSWLVPNAVHPSFFDVPHNPSKPLRLLCVANIAQWKNQVHLIRALKDAFPNPDFELRFLGHGDPNDPYFQEFSTLISQHPWCRFLGFANRKSLQEELSKASLLVLPSLEDNCPMVVLEASAVGVPCAGSAVGGVPDLIEHQKSGVLFDPLDLRELGNTIREMLADPEKLAAMGTYSRLLCMERFSPHKIAREHLKIYQEVLSLR